MPPCCRVVDTSDCVNASKIRSCASGSMPTPESSTLTWSTTRSADSSATLACTDTPPRSVNFTALEQRLVST